MWRLNNNIEIFKKTQSEILVVHRGVGKIHEYEVNDSGQRLLYILRKNGGCIPDALMDSDVKNPISSLSSEGILTEEDFPEKQDPLRSQMQAFNEWNLDSEAAQTNIESANIAIIGVGGTGSWLALQMASFGIKNLTMIDPDKVESSNLVRQNYTQKDVGAYKVTALKRHLLARRSDMKIRTVKKTVSSTSPFEEWFSDCDYILVAGDYPSMDELASIVSQWCCNNQKKHIICGGYSGHNSSLGLSIIPGKTPCWECYMDSARGATPSTIQDENLICAGPRNPAAMVPLVMLAASFSAYELLRQLVGLKPLLAGGRFDFRPDQVSVDKTLFSARQDCKSCQDIQL